MNTIYIDELFFLNLVIDYLIVLASARVCGVRLRRWRYWLSAFFGALYAAGVLLPGLDFLSLPAAKTGCGIAMALIAFGGEMKPVKCSIVFFAVSAAFGGAVWAISMFTGTGLEGGVYIPVSLKVLVISFAVCYGIISLVFSRALKKADRRVLTVGAVFCGKSAVFRALMDTGNALYDPMTGSGVLVVSADVAGRLFPSGCGDALKSSDAIDILEKLNDVPALAGKIRLIPYSAVGVSSGLLPVFRPDSLTVDGKTRSDLMIAVSPSQVGCEEYEAVL